MYVYNYIFKPQWIPSICINVQKAKFPLYVGSFTHISAQACRLDVYDNSDNVIASTVLTRSQYSAQSVSKQVTGGLLAPFTDQYGTVCGQILYSPQLSGFALNILITQHLSKMQLGRDALILSAQCINCVHVKGCKQITFNGRHASNRSTRLAFQRNVTLTGNKEQPQINVYGDKDITQFAKLQYQMPKYLKYVNGTDMTDCHLIVKPRVLSNLRVITSGGFVTFAGVRDAR